MKFKDYLNEDEGMGGEGVPVGDVATPTNTSDNIAGYSLPIGMIRRVNMPQITKELYNEFVADLKINNIEYKDDSIKCGDLTPTQSEFNPDKVKSIKNDIINGTYKNQPILVSKDNLIVDGHHRWKAFDLDHAIPVNKVDLNFNELYSFLQNKPYALRKTIDEQSA